MATIRVNYKCPDCKKSFGYRKTEYKTHILNNHANFEERKNGFTHFCELCNIGYFSIASWNNHLNTKKHKRTIEVFKPKKPKK